MNTGSVCKALRPLATGKNNSISAEEWENVRYIIENEEKKCERVVDNNIIQCDT